MTARRHQTSIISFSMLRSRKAVLIYVQIGFLLNSLLHIYRFDKIGWSSITGLSGQPQSIALSYGLTAWAIVPVLFVKPLAASVGRRAQYMWCYAAMTLTLNQIAGRSLLKGILDVTLLGILFGWELVNDLYATNRDHLKTNLQLQLVHTELMNLFQTTVVGVTFAISVFGFTFAPSYLQTYYTKDIGQPTVWWFGTMAVYLSVGIMLFVSLRCWALAVSKRRSEKTG